MRPRLTFLVTGAAGFIGSHSADYLLAGGHKVIGVDTLRTGRLTNVVEGRRSRSFELVEADVLDEACMWALFRRHRFDGILHLAALVSVPESFRQPALNFEVNLAATDLLARLAIEHGVGRMVFASSAAVYGNAASLPNRESDAPRPMSPYAAAKLASEDLLLGYSASFGISVVCFRYFNVYGPRQDPSSPYSGVLSIFNERFRKRQSVLVYGDGNQTRDFVYVGDIARVNAEALLQDGLPNGRFNVCTGVETSLNKVLSLYREIYPQAPRPTFGPPRRGDVRRSVGDPGRLEGALGMTLRVPFDQGLRSLAACAAADHGPLQERD